MLTHYLYLKIHNITGLKYLGKTTQNPHKYKGSGLHWKRHLAVHGDDISTEILKECTSKEELIEWGQHYSQLWNIVNDKTFANMRPENGDGGFRHSEETCKKLSAIAKARKHSDETRRKIGEATKGRTHSAEIKEKLRQANLGHHRNIGRKNSPETIERMRQAAHKRWAQC